MTYVLSDIHGELELFEKMLKKINFCASDKMIICGDIIEKGKHSVELARRIMGMDNVICTLGNHEYSFVKYANSMMKECESDSELIGKLREFFPDDGDLLDAKTAEYLCSLPVYYEDESIICVHAGVMLDSHGNVLPLERTSTELIVYDRRFKNPEICHNSPKCVFFGHTETSCICGVSKILAYKRPSSEKIDSISDIYKVHLDTGAWSKGVLGCFAVESCKVYYTNK